MEPKSVVVTGASTGIGLAITSVLIGKGIHVFGSVRKQSDANRLQQQFGDRYTPLLMDVTDHAAVQRAAAEVKERLVRQNLFGLVNNAGVAIGGPLLHLEVEELRRQMEINLVGPFIVTQAFAPLLGAEQGRTGAPGRIVQMSSVVGKIAPPFLGAYVASKHALEGMSSTLRRELLLYGIDVIVIGPGAVITPIWDKAQDSDLGRFASTDYGSIIEGFAEYLIQEGRKGLPAESIGDAVYTALMTRNPKTRYAVVPQRFKNWTLPRLLPNRWLDRLIGKQAGLLKK